MRRIIFTMVVLFLLSGVVLSNEQRNSPKFINPFLTPEEEMKELGIKPPEEKKVELESLKKLKLTGIIYGEDKIAIINSGFYREGDEIDGFSIKEIKPLSVILTWDDQQTELKLIHVLAVGEKEKPGEEKKKVKSQGEQIEGVMEK